MRRQPRPGASAVRACAVGLLLWACTSATEDRATSYRCKAQPLDLTACSIDADCATVALGCYCGAQPVNGVASKYAATARDCEDAAASTCALGCANEPGQVAQDGHRTDLGATVAVRCDHSTAGAGTCLSYVP